MTPLAAAPASPLATTPSLSPWRSRSGLAALLIGLAASAPLPAAQCSDLPKPSLKLQRIDEPVTLDNGLGYRSLAQLGPRRLQPGSEIIGLTRGTTVVEVETRLSMIIERHSQLECGTPEVTVAFGYRPMTVYVAHEFPYGSCAYERILEHEMRHVEVYREHLARVEGEIARALQTHLDAWTIERRPAGLTSTLLRREINGEWIPLVRRIISRVEDEQARVDNEEEYQRVINSCQGAIRKGLKAAP